MTPASPIGSVIGGCRLDAVLGHGGMGVVYLAEQLSLRRHVALKLMPVGLADDAEFRARFEQEAHSAASLDHPHVVPIFDYGESGGQLFIVMRYVDGTDLRALLQAEGALAPLRAARIVAQIGSALDAAHARGLVHRDVKPGNVLLRDAADGEHAYLSDFGLTKLADASDGLTRTGQWLGTPDYAAPEQIEGGRVDARSDVYALGCMLYETLTGAVPYPRDSAMARLWAHVNEPSPLPSACDASIPAAFDAIVERALAKDPAGRYASAGGLGRAVTAAAQGRVPPQDDRSVATGAASPLPATVPAPRRVPGRRPAPAPTEVGGVVPGTTPARERRSRRTPLALAALALALLVGGAFGATLLGGDSAAPAHTQVAGHRDSPRTSDRLPVTTTTRPIARRTTPAPTPAPEQAHTQTPPPSSFDVDSQRWSPYLAPAYRMERPLGWATQKDAHVENASRTRSEWSDATCDCDLVVDYVPGYGETALDNASEAPGGSVQQTSVGAFDDAALRTAEADGQHEATYFVADGPDNYAVRAQAPTAETALAIAERAASSLVPYGE